MKYKVGDRVRIKSLDWYNENKNEYGNVRCTDDFLFTPEHSKYCGCEFTVSHITEFQIPSYVMVRNGHEWTDEMIEGLVEEETKPKHEDEVNGTEEKIWIYQMGQIIHCPDGYIFKDENGNVINATKIVLEKKKKEYPKTYEECCKVLGYDDRETYCICHTGANERLFESLYRLKVCRDAYWKIAGDEMGLGKPWEPDWEDEHQEKYIIGSWLGTIQALEENFVSHPFAFPTEEMRDTFKENFYPDLEICKELL